MPRGATCAEAIGRPASSGSRSRTTTSGLLSPTRGTPAPQRSRSQLGAALGWYFALAERVSEGRRFLELALAAARDEAPVNLRIELLASLCFLATEELDLDAAIGAG